MTSCTATDSKPCLQSTISLHEMKLRLAEQDARCATLGLVKWSRPIAVSSTVEQSAQSRPTTHLPLATAVENLGNTSCTRCSARPGLWRGQMTQEDVAIPDFISMIGQHDATQTVLPKPFNVRELAAFNSLNPFRATDVRANHKMSIKPMLDAIAHHHDASPIELTGRL